MLVHIDLFLEYLHIEKNTSSHTIDAYNGDLLQLHDFLLTFYNDEESMYEIDVIVKDDDVEITSISIHDLRGFIEFCYDEKKERKTIERKIATIKSFFKFLYNRDHITINPAKDLIYPKKKKKLPIFLYNKQIDSILDFPLETYFDFRDHAIIVLFFFNWGPCFRNITGKYT